MNIYIWKDVPGVTTRMHSSGGVAVVAASIERARELCPQATDKPCQVYSLLASELERVFIFPNAGCC